MILLYFWKHDFYFNDPSWNQRSLGFLIFSSTFFVAPGPGLKHEGGTSPPPLSLSLFSLVFLLNRSRFSWKTHKRCLVSFFSLCLDYSIITWTRGFSWEIEFFKRSIFFSYLKNATYVINNLSLVQPWSKIYIFSFFFFLISKWKICMFKRWRPLLVVERAIQ